MRKMTVLLAVGLGFLMSHGIQTWAGIVITNVETTGAAGALFDGEDWDAEEFGFYAASGSAASNIGSGLLTANSSASLSFDEVNSTIELSGESFAQTPTQESAGASSLIQIYFFLDHAYSFSLTGFISAAYALPSLILRLVPDNPNERYFIGDSGILSPGNYYIQGSCSSYASGLAEGSSTFQSYTATLSLAPLLTGDFDEDGDVDGADFLAWQRNPAVGNLSDWQTDYGMVAALTANSSAVPEPNSLLLLLLAAACSASRERPSH